MQTICLLSLVGQWDPNVIHPVCEAMERTKCAKYYESFHQISLTRALQQQLFDGPLKLHDQVNDATMTPAHDTKPGE